ncbi:MAG: alpha/beta hydrolase [Candidatus Pelethousia sp.]|nr:alpha/beta hydrolase [Candidatus Pelethousia sp.]
MDLKLRRATAGLRLLGSSQSSLKNARTVQDEMGQLMEDSRAAFEDVSLGGLEASYALPPEQAAGGVILYLHGGGYALGSLVYAKGIGSRLACSAGVKTLCLAYRLTPEHPHPAALEDSLHAYRFLLGQGYTPGRILLCGDEAGGGICFALCLRLKSLGLPQPGGVIAISPWVDLTLSGPSYEKNRYKDPVLDRDALRCCAECYAKGQDLTLPCISPLYGNLEGLPPSLLFAGGNELLLNEIYAMHKSLVLSGVDSRIHIARNMWNSYMLYGGVEGERAFKLLSNFVQERLNGPTVPAK